MGRLLLIAHEYPPSNQVASIRPAKWAKYLPDFGWDVDVLTASVHSERTNGVSPHGTVHRVPDYFNATFSTAHAGLRWVPRLLLSARRLAARTQFDAVLLTGGPFIPFSATSLLKRLVDAPVVLDFRDPWTGQFRTNASATPSGVASTLYTVGSELSEGWVVNAAAMNITPVPELTDKYRAVYPGGRFETIYNGFDPDDYPAVESSAERKRRVVYAGKYYEQVGHFFEAIRDDPVDLVYFGADARVADAAAEYGVAEYVDARGYQPISEIARVLLRSRAGLAVTPNEIAIPQKCYDYLACQTPIIGIDAFDGALSTFLTTTRTGVCTTETQAQSVRDAITQVLDGSVSIDRETVAHFTRKAQTAKLAAVLDSVGSGQSG